MRIIGKPVKIRYEPIAVIEYEFSAVVLDYGKPLVFIRSIYWEGENEDDTRVRRPAYGDIVIYTGICK